MLTSRELKRTAIKWVKTKWFFKKKKRERDGELNRTWKNSSLGSDIFRDVWEVANQTFRVTVVTVCTENQATKVLNRRTLDKKPMGIMKVWKQVLK